MFSSMAESCSSALHRPSARCLSTWVSHLLTPRHCLFCYWCFFVHREDKLQVLGCISASFVRSQMNKTMITSMHLMHWFTNESEAIWGSILRRDKWPSPGSRSYRNCDNSHDRVSRSRHVWQAFVMLFSHQIMPSTSKTHLGNLDAYHFVCRETIQHHEIIFSSKSKRDNSVLDACTSSSSVRNYLNFYWVVSFITKIVISCGIMPMPLRVVYVFATVKTL